MFERFTERARKVVVLAQEEALRFDHNYIGTEHVLLGLLREEEDVACRALETLGVSLAEARERVRNIVGHGEEGNEKGQVPFTPRAKKILEFSLEEALQIGHNYIGTEHILLGLSREPEGVAALVLSNLGVTRDKVQREVLGMLGVTRTGMHQRGRQSSLTERVRRETLRRLGRGEPEDLEEFRGYVAPFEVQLGSLTVSLEFAYFLPRYATSETIDYDELCSGIKEVFDAENPPSVEMLIVETAEHVLERFDEVQEITVEVTVRREPQIKVSKTFSR